MAEIPTEEERLPKKHGEKVSELVDLGVAVARIERQTYVGSEWTELTLMVPRYVDEPAESVHVSLPRDVLNRLVERLAWPTK